MSAEVNVDGRRGGCPLWVRALLVLSLAGNLAVIGLVGGWSMRDHRWSGADADGLDPRQSRLLKAVPESRRDEARALMLAEGARLAETRARMDAVQGEIVAAIRAADFTPDRLDAALAERRAVSSDLNGIVHGQLVAISARMTPAERTEMAGHLEEMARRWAAHRASR